MLVGVGFGAHPVAVRRDEARVIELSTSVELQATPARVWAVLTDFPNYGRWHPLMSLSGIAAPGAQITYSARRSLKSARYVSAEGDIIAYDEPVRLAWRLGIRRLFAIEESFELQAHGLTTIVRHQVRYTGFLSALTASLTRRRAQENMELFDALLAKRLAPKAAATVKSVPPKRSRHRLKPKRRR